MLFEHKQGAPTHHGKQALGKTRKALKLAKKKRSQSVGGGGKERRELLKLSTSIYDPILILRVTVQDETTMMMIHQIRPWMRRRWRSIIITPTSSSRCFAAAPPVTGGPKPAYDRLVLEGKLMPDANQSAVVDHLQELYRTLEKYTQTSPALQLSPYLLQKQTTTKRWIFNEMLNLLVPKGECHNLVGLARRYPYS